MARTYYGIFNDVLGPVMTGPSSSHSAGCARIGLTARSLVGREITHADVIFEQQGSYPSTYIGQGSSYGFTGGLMGCAAPPTGCRLDAQVSAARPSLPQLPMNAEAPVSEKSENAYELC